MRVAIVVLAGLCLVAAAQDPRPVDPRFAKSADPIIENILEALTKNDYDTYTMDFGVAMRRLSTPDAFATARRQINTAIGACKSREPLGVLDQDGLEVFLWKARFEKTEADVLIKLVLSEQEGTTKVSGLWFDWGR